MTREEAISIIQREYSCVDRECNIERSCGKCDLMMSSKEPILEAFNMAIKALEQEPCEDAISRRAVLDEICDYNHNLDYTTSELYDRIKRMSPVKQEPKTGHWEWVQYDSNPNIGNWHCSECRCVVVECVDKKSKGGIPLYKYCPQCGCRIVESQESEVEE